MPEANPQRGIRQAPDLIVSAPDIVVTAQKRSERLRETPVPVTVLSATQLIEQNRSRLQDYYSQVPGLALTAMGDGTSVIVIRGIVAGNFSNPTVAVSIDDVPFGSSTALAGGQLLQPDFDPSDLQQIEMLRGPQGTLYGASSLGGLVKYVTSDPVAGATFGRANVDVSATEDGTLGYGVRGAVNVPLGEGLAVRGSGYARRTPGFVDNALAGRNINATDVTGGRLSLLWRGTETAAVKLGLLHQYAHGHGAGLVTTDFRQRPVFGDLAQVLLPDSGAHRMRTTLATINVDLSLDWADVKSITGYGRNVYRSQSDRSALLLSYAPNTKLGNDMRTRKFTQELRLSSPAGQAFGWLIGGFYTRERSSTVQTIDAVEAGTGRPIANQFTANFPTSYEEVALFGDATVHFSSAFNVQAGLRYSRNHQSYDETDTGPRGEVSPGVPFVASARSRDHSVTFLVTPQYRFSSRTMAYLRFASGYRPGGPNGSAALLGLPDTFGADTTLNYEIGVKGSALNGALSYDLSAYYIDWRSIQLRVVDAATQFSYFTNGGKAHSSGIEAAYQYRAARGLNLSASASYNVAEFSNDPPPGIIAARGDRLPYSARFSGSLSADQDWSLGVRWTAFVGGTLSYVGRRLSAFPSRPGNLRVVLPAYATLDSRIGVRSDAWTISLFARNLTDKRGVLGSTPQGARALTTSLYNTSVIQPRTVGLSASRSF